MGSAFVYIDESGDLGWKFDKPYRQGGSSRHLTIGALFVLSEKRELPKRLVRRLYRKHKWNTLKEKKWADMGNSQRESFAQLSADLSLRAPEVNYFSITVRKEKVLDHIRSDPNKLYNYMINLLLLDELLKYENVTLVPDPRTVKVESGNSMHDYLQTNIWFEKNSSTTLATVPCDSAQSLNIQFTDMLCGAVQSHYEDGNSAAWQILQPHIKHQSLFFS